MIEACRKRSAFDGALRRASPAAGAAAEHAEFGAVRVIERHRPCRLAKGGAKFEALVVGEQRAGYHRRARGTLALYDHARGRAHYHLRRFSEDAPTCLG